MMRRAVVLGVVVALVAAVAACGDDGNRVDGTTSSSVASAPSALDSSEPWDLVWFSDSSGHGLAELWAERIEETRGVEVEVHDYSGPGLVGSASFIATLIQTGEVERALVGAEIIGLYTNPAGTQAGDGLGEVCSDSDPTPRDPPEVYAAEDFGPFADILREIYAGIFDLRDGVPVIIRAIDLHVPVLAQWRSAGIEPECTAGWEAWTSTLRQVAKEHGVPTASMYDAFNGPDHQALVDEALIGADGVHPSEEGNAAQVNVLDALGYEPVTP